VELPGKGSLGLLQGDTRLQADHHFDPVEIAVEEAGTLLGRGIRRERRNLADGQEERRIGLRIDSEKPGGRDARDGKGLPIDANRLAHGRRIAMEAALPVGIGQHHGGGRAGAVVVFEQQAAGRGRHTQSAEVVSGNESAGNGL